GLDPVAGPRGGGPAGRGHRRRPDRRRAVRDAGGQRAGRLVHPRHPGAMIVQLIVALVLAVAAVEVGAQPELHRRYRIDAVPITVVADRAGVVRASFVGPASATDLWAAV